MAYQLGLDTPNSPPHPSFKYDTLDEARGAVSDAVTDGFYKVPGQGITIQTGAGTIYKVVSEERLQEGAPSLEPFNYVLVVGIGPAQISLGYNSEGDMADAVTRAVKNSVLRHCAKKHHEYTTIEGAPGRIYMEMTKVEFNERQHQMAAEMQRQQEAAAAKVPRILRPGQG